jgi:integrase
MAVLQLRPRLKSKPQKLSIKRVKKKLADGSIKVYLYHRKTGDPLDPDNLIQSYAASEKKKIVSPGQPMYADLINRFETSPYYDGLSEATKEDWAWRLKIIRPRWGTVPLEAFATPEDAEAFRRDVLEWHEELGRDRGRRAADAIVAGMARVLSYAYEKSVIRANPLTRFKRHYKNDRSEMTWSDDLVVKFLEVARPQMVTAMYIVRNLGQRQKDIRELPWSAYDGQTILVRQSKGNKRIRIPVPRELKRYLDGLPRTDKLILTTATGKPFTKVRFNELWREAAKAAGADGLHFHDLRGTAATRLAEAGCTAPQIASVMGWSVKKAQQMIDTYVATSGVLAAQAIEKLEEHRDRQEVLRTSSEQKTETKVETKWSESGPTHASNWFSFDISDDSEP